MSSNATSIASSSKVPIASSPFNFSQTPSYTTPEPTQKRSNSSGHFGAGSQTRQSTQPRNQQALKKQQQQQQQQQHKTQRKVRLVDDDAYSELAAMKSINSRKGQTSITHLMNFTLPPRPQYQPQQHHHHNHRQPRYNRTWGLGSGYHAIDKARYVHANYRFIVRPDKEYHAQTEDADVYVGWDSILQILASTDTQSTNCPICLSTPVAPRMAKCGHIFCLPCLIRYMHSSDDTHPVPERRARWKKCPICEDSIYVSEVRPVRWFSGQEASMLREGGDVLLKLIKRHPGTTLALPRDVADKYGVRPDIPWYHVAAVMDYARFMKGGEDYMTEQYKQEITALEIQEQEDELLYGDDITWTRKAINAVVDATLKVKDMGNPPSALALHDPARVPETWDEDALPSESTEPTLSNGISKLAIDNRATAASKARTIYYFYHAQPNFFLSPLDIRILKAAFGDFPSFPSTILPRVEHISTGHLVDDDLRKRAKYMAHLPYGFEVTFLECDWTDVISPAILEQFSEDIQRRRRRNHEKEAREERDRIRAEKAEDDKRWAAARQKRPGLTEKSLSTTDFVPLMLNPSSPPQHDSETLLSHTPPWGNARSQSSFATLASPGTSPEGPKTVWGTAAVAPSTPPPAVATPPPPIDDGWVQDWEKDLLDEPDPVAMVEAAVTGESSTKARQAGGAKKGKKKKITLMSTTVRRGA